MPYCKEIAKRHRNYPCHTFHPLFECWTSPTAHPSHRFPPPFSVSAARGLAADPLVPRSAVGRRWSCRAPRRRGGTRCHDDSAPARRGEGRGGREEEWTDRTWVSCWIGKGRKIRAQKLKQESEQELRSTKIQFMWSKGHCRMWCLLSKTSGSHHRSPCPQDA